MHLVGIAKSKEGEFLKRAITWPIYVVITAFEMHNMKSYKTCYI